MITISLVGVLHRGEWAGQANVGKAVRDALSCLAGDLLPFKDPLPCLAGEDAFEDVDLPHQRPELLSPV